jgi:hypothetical protein
MEVVNDSAKEKTEMQYREKPSCETVRQKLRRLADFIKQGQRSQIQVAGESISMPANAVINTEHERDDSSEEFEFQIKCIFIK